MSMTSGNERPFYEDPKAYKRAGILSLAGCVFMLAATVLFWMNTYVRYTETSYGGFSFYSSVKRGLDMMVTRDLEGNVIDRVFSFKSSLPLVLFIMYWCVVLFLAFLGLKDHILMEDVLVDRRKTVRLGLLGAVVVLMFLMSHTSVFRGMASEAKNMVSGWRDKIILARDLGMAGADHMKYMYFVGPGLICFWIGVLLYLGSIVYRFVIDTLNEDDEPAPPESRQETDSPVGESDELQTEQKKPVNKTIDDELDAYLSALEPDILKQDPLKKDDR